jgi:hypothetical protein
VCVSVCVSVHSARLFHTINRCLAVKVFPKLLMRESTIERHATLGYPVPTDPGLGIEINEEALIAQPPFKHWNPPFLRRKDGSLNNW